MLTVAIAAENDDYDAEVTNADALSLLRERPSFRHFEAQLADWR